MNHRLALASAVLALCGCAAVAQATWPDPKPITPESVPWGGPPNNPGLKGAWMLGSESAQEMYAFRVRMAPGTRIPVHTHPDTRFSTVISGTLYVGFAGAADDAKLVAIPAGAVYVAPAGVPHFLYAKDGEVVYQESGQGPTATVPYKP